jgi:hypothetical protein
MPTNLNIQSGKVTIKPLAQIKMAKAELQLTFFSLLCTKDSSTFQYPHKAAGYY